MAPKTKTVQTPLETLKAEYDKKLRAEIEGRLQNLRELVDNALVAATNEIIANAIGIRKDRWSFDRWEVDSSRSVIARELGEEALRQVKAAIPGFVKEWVKTPNKKLRAAMQREFEDSYERALLKHVEQAAEEMARKDAMALLEAFKQEKDTDNG